MWTIFRFQVDGGGVVQNPKASSMQTMTAICFFETEVLTRAGTQRASDQRECRGDIQNVAEDESELAEDEGEDCPEDRSKLEKEGWEEVAKRLGDLSTKAC